MIAALFGRFGKTDAGIGVAVSLTSVGFHF